MTFNTMFMILKVESLRGSMQGLRGQGSWQALHHVKTLKEVGHPPSPEHYHSMGIERV